MESIEDIYREHANSVYAFLLAKTQDCDVAEELTQETFFEAIKNIHKYKGNSSILTWLCGIAKNLWYQHLRENKKTSPFEDMDYISVSSIETEVLCNWDHMQIIKQIHDLQEPN